MKEKYDRSKTYKSIEEIEVDKDKSKIPTISVLKQYRDGLKKFGGVTDTSELDEHIESLKNQESNARKK